MYTLVEDRLLVTPSLLEEMEPERKSLKSIVAGYVANPPSLQESKESWQVKPLDATVILYSATEMY